MFHHLNPNPILIVTLTLNLKKVFNVANKMHTFSAGAITEKYPFLLFRKSFISYFASVISFFCGGVLAGKYRILLRGKLG